MEQMISNLGFPIAGAVGMAGVLVFLIKYLLERDKQHREDVYSISCNKVAQAYNKSTVVKFNIN